ncbi:MAG: 30S ribosomal protein S20, partial [bacterium]|nr:30S ribosomal protein S20 [bacterium]
MANTKSAIKRARTSILRNLRNRKIKTGVRTAVRKFNEAVGTGNEVETLRAAHSKLDRSANKGAIHRNAAARK